MDTSLPSIQHSFAQQDVLDLNTNFSCLFFTLKVQQYEIIDSSKKNEFLPTTYIEMEVNNKTKIVFSIQKKNRKNRYKACTDKVCKCLYFGSSILHNFQVEKYFVKTNFNLQCGSIFGAIHFMNIFIQIVFKLWYIMTNKDYVITAPLIQVAWIVSQSFRHNRARLYSNFLLLFTWLMIILILVQC